MAQHYLLKLKSCWKTTRSDFYMCFEHVRRGIPLFIQQQAEANQKGFSEAAWSERLKEIYWLVRCVNKGEVTYSLLQPNQPYQHVTTVKRSCRDRDFRVSRHTDHANPGYLRHLATLIFSLCAGSSICKSEPPSEHLKAPTETPPCIPASRLLCIHLTTWRKGHYSLLEKLRNESI